jgi:hypothetical protein
MQAGNRRGRVFSFFDFRSSFSRCSDFIEASRVKKRLTKTIENWSEKSWLRNALPKAASGL